MRQITVDAVASVPAIATLPIVTVLETPAVAVVHKLSTRLTQYVVVDVGATVMDADVCPEIILLPTDPVPHWKTALVPGIPPVAVSVSDDPAQDTFAPSIEVGGVEATSILIKSSLTSEPPPFSRIRTSTVEFALRLKLPAIAPVLQALPPLQVSHENARFPST